MELRQLRHFTAVIEHGTVHAAARSFGLSQPAITRSVQTLEADLNVKLLRRKGRQVLPTAAGAAFFRHAQLIINESERARTEVALAESGTTGEVNIGVGSMFSNYIIDEAVLEIAAHAPDVLLRVHEGYFEELNEKLLAGTLDFVFINFPRVKMHADVNLEILLELHTELMARAAHPLARKRKLTLADTSDQRWVLIDQQHASSHFEGTFLQAGLPIPRNKVMTNSLNLIRSLTMHGDFVTYLPTEWFAADIQAGRIKVLNCPPFMLTNQVGLMTRAGQYHTPATLQVIDKIRKVCAGFAAG